MKKAVIFSAVMVISLGMVSCASQPGQPGVTNEQGGTVIGAITGGILGSQIGSGTGKTVATIGGTLLGGFLGNRVGDAMDQSARNKAEFASQQAMNTGHSENWSGGNAHGTITPKQAYYNEKGQRCRKYTSSIVVDGKLQTAQGTACLNPHTGRWYIVS